MVHVDTMVPWNLFTNNSTMDHVSQMIGTMELVSKVTCTQKIGTMELVSQVT